jgi:hypothetical protein
MLHLYVVLTQSSTVTFCEMHLGQRVSLPNPVGFFCLSVLTPKFCRTHSYQTHCIFVRSCTPLRISTRTNLKTVKPGSIPLTIVAQICAISDDQLKSGAIVLHIIGMIYGFSLLAVICDDYFIPTVECICEDLNISKVKFRLIDSFDSKKQCRNLKNMFINYSVYDRINCDSYRSRNNP